jgi:hypothetical protein
LEISERSRTPSLAHLKEIDYIDFYWWGTESLFVFARWGKSIMDLDFLFVVGGIIILAGMAFIVLLGILWVFRRG